MSVDTANGPGTVVGVNVALSGTLKDQNDIIVYGMVDGEVISERSVTVGQSAQVKGPIRGGVVTVAGTVRGSIEAGEKLELMETGRVYGSISAKDLIVRSGALLIGKVAMEGEGLEETAEQSAETPPEENVEPAEATTEEAKDNDILAPDEE